MTAMRMEKTSLVLVSGETVNSCYWLDYQNGMILLITKFMKKNLMLGLFIYRRVPGKKFNFEKT